MASWSNRTSRAELRKGSRSRSATIRRGDPIGKPLLAVATQDSREVGLGVGIEHLRRRELLRSHSHVQWRVLGVGKPPLGIVDLQRGHTKIKQDPLDFGLGEPREHLGELIEHGLDERHPVGELGQPLPRESQRLLITVQPDQPGLGACRKQRVRMATETECAVEENAVVCPAGSVSGASSAGVSNATTSASMTGTCSSAWALMRQLDPLFLSCSRIARWTAAVVVARRGKSASARSPPCGGARFPTLALGDVLVQRGFNPRSAGSPTWHRGSCVRESNLRVEASLHEPSCL